MNIFRLVISFITISYIAIFNVAIASTPEQEPSNVKVQSEEKDKSIESSLNKKQHLLDEKTNTTNVEKQQTETTSKSNGEEISKDKSTFETFKSSFIKLISNPTAIASVIAAFVGALISSIVALIIGRMHYHIEKERQTHSEKMQKEKNEQELLLLKEKNEQELLLLKERNKQEKRMLFLSKKIDVYIEARKKLTTFTKDSKAIPNYNTSEWISLINMFCSSEVTNLIDKHKKVMKDINFKGIIQTIKTKGEDSLSQKDLDKMKEFINSINAINEAIKAELKELEGEIKSYL